MAIANKSQTGSSRKALRGWTIQAKRIRGLADCTLIVPTYKRSREVADLLRTLAGLEDCPGEVILADASPDSSTEEVVRDFVNSGSAKTNVIYVRCPAGLTLQRNIGIDLSSKKFIFFLDDDCLPQTAYFTNVRQVFINDANRAIGAVGGSVLNEMDRPIPRRWRIRLNVGLVPQGNPLFYHPCGTSVPRGLMQPFKGIRPANVLPGCALAFRREVLDEQRFSEFFYGYSQGEDLEMSLRVAGRWEVVCCGDAHVLHHHSPGGRPAAFKKGRMEVRNRYFIWKRHVPKPSNPDSLRFWADLHFLVLLDFFGYCVRPWRFVPLAHAAGLMAGVVDCVIRKQNYDEPLARTKYTLAVEESQCQR